MIFGYARVSTVDQNLEIQINVLENMELIKSFLIRLQERS